VKKLALILTTIFLAISLSACTNEDVGTVGGAVAGGVIGSQFGSGTGKTAATIGGAVVGGYVGREVGRSYDYNQGYYGY